MNREALGATLEVITPARTQVLPVIRASSFLGSNDPRNHVGLGAAETFDVRVTWPGLAREQTTFRGLAADRHWRLSRDGAKAEQVPLKSFDWGLPPER
jgi:hypothetical protein